MKYGDVVIIVWQGHHHDRACGTVGQLNHEVGAEVAAGDVPVLVRGVGLVEVPPENLRRFGLERASDVPRVGDMVELVAEFPALGVAKFQLARVLEIGPMTEAAAIAHGVEPGAAGYRLDTAGPGGRRVRGWVLPEHVQPVGAGHARHREDRP